MALTAAQIKYVKEQRAKGHTWAEVARNFTTAYGESKTADSMRMALKNSGSTAPAAKASQTTSARRRIKEDAKVVDHQEYNCVMVIPDLHIPYHHPEALDFLELVKDTYEPDKIVCLGDELDKHAMSFHDSDPDLPSAGDELQEAIEYLQDFYEIFPEVSVVDSNHGSMHFRKAKHHGIPMKYLRNYADILEAPDGWRWCHELNINCGGVSVRFRHDFGKDILRAAEQAACCLIQGHFHEMFNIQYSGNSDRLIWAVTSGCLIDDDSLAFQYNKINRKRPILGCTMILNGYPVLIPMLLKRGGQWVGEIP